VQKRLWVDGQERQYQYDGVRTELKKPKISLHISLVLAEEKCMKPQLNFLSDMDGSRRTEVVVKVVNSEHKQLSDGGV
jgi:hypothetical protein